MKLTKFDPLAVHTNSNIARPLVGWRRGVVLAAAMACCFVTLLLSAGLTASALHRHRQVQRELRSLQAAWLAESALDRAVARLAADADYAGETWSIPAAELDGRYGGKATIVVARDDEHAAWRRVTVEAAYPDDPMNRTRAEKTRLVRVGDAEATE